MSTDPADETDPDIGKLLNELDDDWGPLEWLDPVGAMAIAGLAIHCRAQSPTMNVHIKIYLRAEGNGTPDYLRTGSAERIERLYHRFEEIADERKLQTVPIHKLHRFGGGLIVIMDCVTIVKKLFGSDAGTLKLDAPRALRELDTQRSWMHFDVCPKNVGQTTDGMYCYLDLESLYKVGEAGVTVSEPLTKLWRIPGELFELLAADLRSPGHLSPELANRFQNHQLARLAMDMFAGVELDGANVEKIVEEQPVGHPDMWKKHFVDLVKGGLAPEPEALACAIEDCIFTDTQLAPGVVK